MNYSYEHYDGDSPRPRPYQALGRGSNEGGASMQQCRAELADFLERTERRLESLSFQLAQCQVESELRSVDPPLAESTRLLQSEPSAGHIVEPPASQADSHVAGAVDDLAATWAIHQGIDSPADSRVPDQSVPSASGGGDLSHRDSPRVLWFESADPVAADQTAQVSPDDEFWGEPRPVDHSPYRTESQRPRVSPQDAAPEAPPAQSNPAPAATGTETPTEPRTAATNTPKPQPNATSNGTPSPPSTTDSSDPTDRLAAIKARLAQQMNKG